MGFFNKILKGLGFEEDEEKPEKVKPNIIKTGEDSYKMILDFDDKETKEKQLVKVYDLLDDYLDPENEEGGDLQSLYNDLSAEMEKNSFLSKMLAKEVQTAKKKPIKK